MISAKGFYIGLNRAVPQFKVLATKIPAYGLTVTIPYFQRLTIFSYKHVNITVSTHLIARTFYCYRDSGKARIPNVSTRNVVLTLTWFEN